MHMLNLNEIHRPATLDEALELLKQPGTVPLAGGTGLLAAQRKDVSAVVDLSSLPLAYLRARDGALTIGATTPLAKLAESAELRAVANGVVAQAAHRSASNLLRNQATVAGTLIAEPEGLLAVVLTALDATLTLYPSLLEGEGGVRVGNFLKMLDHFLMHSLVTEIVIPASSASRRAAIETVARTPRDKPIVSVCAALELENDSVCAAAIALGGVGEVAVRASEAEKKLVGQKLTAELIGHAASITSQEVNPPSDFRGSAEYRREMVRVLVARVLRGIA